MEPGTRPVVFVVSDSLGETAEQVVRAAASQFNTGHIEIRRVAHVGDRESILAVVREAARIPSIIVYTLVMPELRYLLWERATQAGIPNVDIMGPTMEALARVIETEPKLQPGLVYRLDEEYFRRVDAVEFAVKYDDGKDPSAGVRGADVVLIGVSRTSKTPVSMYLAHRRLKVANVPLMPEVEPPRELFLVPPGKVVGLTILPDKLLEIRRERLKAIGLGANAGYADPKRILEELEYAEGVFQRLGCPVIDVSYKAVEETASRVLEIVRRGSGYGDNRTGD